MKDKLKEFLKAKKELFVFLGLLTMTFVAVIAISSVTVKVEDELTIAPTPDVDQDDDTIQPEPEVEEPVVVSTFNNPVNVSYVIVRDFFDFNSDENSINSMYTNANGGITTSVGVSYATEEGLSFEVFTIYPGTVLNITEDEVIGYTVEIDHGDDLISTYYSLQSTCVVIGEIVSSDTVIGTAGATSFDIEAGVHVHVEVFSNLDEQYIDLTTIVGKTMDDIVSSIK